ncbi:hypothetical protein llap_5349 [Limosa lapponica baueri]|uniref:Uncharacterized protein n=1 Tax=Limosa lapponica baueri TaxID=1758121 RepID=A0A2I0UE76_LIMLA|nr:hypothetical protein llap_5349 [Limosa lapponica baueri]
MPLSTDDLPDPKFSAIVVSRFQIRQYLLLLGLQQKCFTPLKRGNLNDMPVKRVSLKASVMSRLIITSGPKDIPEVQTSSVTSLDPIHQHSAATFLGQERDVSLYPGHPLSSQKYVTFALAAPCAIEVAAVSG